jgi:glycosyltransferase involved in cell wall biosynthesis
MHVVNGLERGGAEFILLSLLPGLAKAGAHVDLVTLKGPGPLDDEMASRGVHVRRLARGRLGVLLRAATLSRWIRERDPHIVHTHLFISDCLGGLAALASGRRRIVSTLYNDGSWMAPHHRAMERIIRRLSRVTIAVSESSRGALIERGAHPDRVVTIAHSTVEATEADARRAGGGLDATAESPTICCVSRLVPIKEIGLFLRAAARARVRHPGLRAWIVGDGPEKLRLKAEARALGLGGAVEFLGAVRDARELMARASVVVLTSRSEGLPMTLVEAMALGKPIVATRVGGVPEIVVDGITGLVVPPGDFGAVADAIVRILDAPALAANLGREARRAFLGRWTAERMVDQYAGLYRSLLEKG